MAGKQIKVDLLFNANIVNAQNNIKQLNTLLNSISKNTVIGIENGPLSQAVSSAQQLQRYLQQATDVNTGKIDLSKLNTSLYKKNSKNPNFLLFCMFKNILLTSITNYV